MPLSSRASAATLVLATLTALAPSREACGSTRECARLVVVDGLADPGTAMPAGAVIDVDTSLPPDQNAAVVGGIGPSRFLTGIATDGSAIFVTDIEADPSGLGPDANGNPGRGAVFTLDGAGGLVLVADGTACSVALPGCGPSGVFTDPLGLARVASDGSLLVADLDADPSALGPDTRGFAGHGAIFRVDPATGVVTLVADGSLYPSGIPNGAPSIFEDPLAVEVARDGRIFVVDQLAQPMRGTGAAGPGAVFEIDPSTGTVTLVAVFPQARGLRDVASEPLGTLLVLDRIQAGGTVHRIDPALPAGSNVLGSFPVPELVDAQGLVVEGNGTIHVIDAAADPLGSSTGALFRIDPAFGAPLPESASPIYAAPWGLDLLAAESLDSATPGFGDIGSSLTVTLDGGIFEPSATVDFGPDVSVDAVRVLSPTQLEADITISAAAPPQLVDVRVNNPTMRTHAFHCEIFELRPSGGCAPSTNMGNSLRLRKPEPGRVELRWDGTGDACTSSFRVRRALDPRPSAGAGTWPSDPAFDDITTQDLDGSRYDETFMHAPTPDPLECFLITEVGAAGAEGPSGHYGG